VNRLECLQVLEPLLGPTDLVITALGATTAAWFSLRPNDERTFAKSGMGGDVPMGTGLALALPHRRVVVLDNDGSQLSVLGSLATLGNVRPPNLRVFVFDNEGYEETGGQPSATRGRTDLAAVARAVGIDGAVCVTTLTSFEAAARRALANDGLGYVVAKIELGPGRAFGGGPNRYEQATRFIRGIEASEGVRILGGG
jgi:thiamine pyrophosphate-dependent acetolactate synthase large subunit-like protein